MMPVLIFLLTVSVFGVVVFVYLRREQAKIITIGKDDEYFYNLFQTLKHPPLALRVFYIVFCIHFLITFKSPDLDSNWTLAWFILSAPSYMIMIYVNRHLPIISDFLDTMNSVLLKSLVLGVTSLMFGVIAGFLASKKWHLQIISVVALCVFILFGLYIAFWAYFVQG
jgi:hypothetical protein